jgi:hypothetical protein
VQQRRPLPPPHGAAAAQQQAVAAAAHDAGSQLFQAFKDECACVFQQHKAGREGPLRTKAVEYPGVDPQAKNTGRAGSVYARLSFMSHKYRLTKLYPAGTSTAEFEAVQLGLSTSYRVISKLIATRPVAGVVQQALSDGGWEDKGGRTGARKERAEDLGDGLGRGLLG